MIAVPVKKYLKPLIIGTVLGLLLALLYVYLEFGGVTETFSPYAPEGFKR